MSILHNIRILDFTWVLAGPYATRLLADFGAEVIKVQPRLSPEADDAFARGYYATWNRNKMGITLDPGKPEGAVLVKKLVKHCDAVIENFTPRVMANWGLDYASLKEPKPDIIMVSMSAMGQTGPLRNYTGFGPNVHAFSGMTRLTSFPGGPPLGPGFSYADHIAGLYASLALLGALEYRRKTGQGQHIDISEVEAILSLLGNSILEAAATGKDSSPQGNESLQATPQGVYRCKDGRWCAITVSNDEGWRGLKKALGYPAPLDEERFATLAGRLEHKDEIDRVIKAWTKNHPALEVMRILQENDVAAGVVSDAADLAVDPHLKSREFFIQPSEDTGPVITDAVPIKMSGASPEYVRPAPSPGQDNDYVYRQLLGLTDSQIDELQHKGVI